MKPQGEAQGEPYILGVTGASGAIYARRLLRHLHDLGAAVHVVATEQGRQVLAYEGHKALLDEADEVYRNDDLFSPIASGSYRHKGMVIAPCSMASLGKIAHGIGDNLLTRAADATLKERRRLIVLPRETPMHAVHLRNPATRCDLGAVVIPPNPALYLKPLTIDDLVDTVLARVLDHLGLDHPVSRRWREMDSGAGSIAGSDALRDTP
jgi:4-hydroxy-3-polyprenylbenzoate decarboxylase